MAVPSLSNYKSIEPENLGEDVELLIVDHYGLDHKFETSCRDWANTIMVIDDLADRKHDCDILLDQTFGRDAKDYKSLVPNNCRILVGCDYALLRPEFIANRESALKRRNKQKGEIRNLLVFLGGTDPDNITQKVLNAFTGVKQPLDINVVMGAGAPHVSKIKALTNQESPHNINLHIDVKDMGTLMINADLAIGAGGTTSWERCCLGLPSLVVEIADNQKKISEELQNIGAIINLGWHAELKSEDIAEQVNHLLENPNKIMSISKKSSNVCVGDGTLKIVKIINEHCNGLVEFTS